MKSVSGAGAIVRLRKLLRIGVRRRLLLAEASVSVLGAMILLRFFSFQTVTRGWRFAPLDPSPAAPTPSEERTARAVGWAVRTAARPFGATCLRQALAARAMLARRGVRTLLHFGVRSDENSRLMAHAWVDAGGVPVTGYPLDAGWSEVGCFLTEATPR